MAEDIGDLRINIGMDGTEVESSVKTISQRISVLGSELREQASRVGGFGSSLEGLRSRSNNLNQQLELQRQRVSELSARYEEAVRTGGEYSNNALNIQRQINNTRTQINRLERQVESTNEQIRIQSSRWTTLGDSMRNISNRLAPIGENFTKVGKTLSLAITAPLLAVGGASFKMASDMNETLNKVDVAFKGNAKEIKKWGDTTLEAYGISKSTALDMASLYGDMGTAMGQSTGEASKMSTNLVGLAGDLSSFKNIGIQQAQDALKGIFTGEGESLKSLGVIMQDSTLKAFALSSGQKKSYEEMTQAEKVALRYAFVMDATKNAQGDFARTSDGTANQMKIMQESLKEVATEFGQILIPAITPFIEKLNDMVKSFKDLSPETKQFIVIGGAIALAVGPILVVIGTVISAIGAIAGAFAAVSGAIATAGGIVAVITGPVGIAVGVIGGLIAAGILLYKNWDTIKAKLSEFGKYISNLWTDIKNSVTNIVTGFINYINTKFESQIKSIKIIFDSIKNIFSATWELIKNIFLGAILIIIDIFTGNFAKLKTDISQIWGNISKNFSVVWENIKNIFSEYIKIIIDTVKQLGTDAWNLIIKLKDNIVETLKELPSKMLQLGKDIVNGLINGIGSLIDSVKNKAKELATSVSNSIKNVLDIRSPSGVTQKFGKNIDEGLADGIEKNKNLVTDATKELAKEVTKQLDNLGNATIKALTSRYNREERIQTDSLNNQIEQVRIATDRKIKEYDRELIAKLKLLDDGTNNNLKSKQAEIDAINKATKDEEKALKEKQFQDEYVAKQRELIATNSAEEKAKIQAELDKMLSEKQREVLLERRQVAIEDLRNEMQLIREKSDNERKELIANTEVKKSQEKIAADFIIASLKFELESTKKHYENLLKEENIQAEARRLALQNNNDELIKLLEEYNPKWQDAGQSFAESLLAGLNSKKQEIQSAIAEIMAMVSSVSGLNKGSVSSGIYGGALTASKTNTTSTTVNRPVNVTVQGSVVGSGGIKELAKTISSEISGNYGLSTGGVF